MKWIGYSLIFLSAVAVGYYASLQLEKRREQLILLRKAVLSIKREIDYQLSPLSEAFLHTAKRTKDPWKSFLEEMGEKLTKDGIQEADFFEIWQKEMKKISRFHPWKEDLALLQSLGQGLGQLDKEMQLSQLKLFEEELFEAEKEAGEEGRKKGHLYRMLGPCMGLLVIILLL